MEVQMLEQMSLLDGGAYVAPARNKFQPRSADQTLEPISQWSPEARMELSMRLLEGALLGSLQEALVQYKTLRNDSPESYWAKLRYPANADDKEFRDNLIRDISWVIEKDQMFVGCMAAQSGNVETFIDLVRLGFPDEVKFIEELRCGGALFSGLSNESTSRH
jgi:hypothetical protein